MLNAQSVKEIETLCLVIAQKNKISFQDAFARLTDEQQAIYDELMTREYKTKLNQVYGADWMKKASPVLLYQTSLKIIVNTFIVCNLEKKTMLLFIFNIISSLQTPYL